MPALRRQRAHHGMPAIARADDHGINVIAFEDFLVKPSGSAISVPVVGIHELLRAGPAIGEEIADGAHCARLLGQETLECSCGCGCPCDARHRDPIRRGSCPAEAERRGRHHQRRGRPPWRMFAGVVCRTRAMSGTSVPLIASTQRQPGRIAEPIDLPHCPAPCRDRPVMD